MSEQAKYQAKRRVHIEVEMMDERGNAFKTCRLFYPPTEAIPQCGMVSDLIAKPGTVVSRHFKPMNDVAIEDRANQLAEPEKYVKTMADAGMLAEMLVEQGWFSDDVRTRRDGLAIVKRTAKMLAMDSLKEHLGDAVWARLEKGDEADVAKDKVKAIEELSKLGNDDKETRKALVKMLRDNGITKGYFPGGPVDKLAEFVFDNGLFKG